VLSPSRSRPRSSSSCPVASVEAFARTIPTDAPESDGTLEWDSTTIVVVLVHAGDTVGLGYTYTHDAAVRLIEDKLAPAVVGLDVSADPLSHAWHEMGDLLRNVGRPGMGFMALSAIDIALWDLKARLVERPLAEVLGAVRDEAAVYGSGGFTSYSLETLAEQLAGWVAQGIPRVKMKVGREPARDRERARVAREAVGDETELYVDANGAFQRQDALEWSHVYAEEFGVKWFEEPVSSDDLEGLQFVREKSPPGIEIAAGEYGDVLPYFERMAPVVDCLQIDVTRCGGITGMLEAAAVAHAHNLDVSAHCAPAISAHAFCAVPRLRHLEYFHDHVRVEGMVFDGVPEPEGDVLRPDLSRPGHGLELKPA
jgi:L-alanine-DL-glutamate epimerase-like enolase superfamily enzyme